MWIATLGMWVLPYSNIGLEDQLGGRLMTEHLIQLGHRRIAFLSDNRIGNDWMRWLGYCEAMEQAGLPYSEAENYIQIRSGRAFDASLARALTPRGRYTALFFASDYYAMRGMDYLYDRGIRVPADLSVAGFDDNVLGQNLRPRLTHHPSGSLPEGQAGLWHAAGDHRRGTAGRGDHPRCPYPW